jgi:Fe2+ or Zn2+ uptake regulation protein
MIELIKQILIKCGCMHKWKIHDESRVFHDDKDTKPYEIRQTLVCNKCGQIKQIKL